MKIGFLIYSLGGGGAERAVSNLANELTQRGEDIYIYTFDSEHKIAYDLDNQIHVRIYSNAHASSIIGRMGEKVIWLKHQFKLDSVDIVFAFMISMLPYALLATTSRCKVVGTERTNPMLHNKKNRFIMKFLSPLCDGFVFQTEGARQYYPLKVQRKAIVIQNPVRSDIEKKEKLPGINVCAAGRKEINKDFSTIIQAFAIFNRAYPESRLSIFGDSELEKSLQDEVKQLGIKECVLFKGFVKNLPYELSAYTMFVFSSKAEGMPNVLMEAMAAGLPCIATDCKFGPGELIENHVNGILVNVGDVDEMTEAMKQVNNNADKRLYMGKAAERIKQTHSLDKITQRYVDYIQNIIKKD